MTLAANRALNHITIHDYPAGTVRNRIDMPPIQEFQSWIADTADPRLGFHHSVLTG